MEQHWSASQNEKAAFEAVQKWITAKLETGEGFSVLLISVHPSGSKISKYSLGSVEEAMLKCRADLQGELKGAEAYALAYDARYKEGETIRPILFYQLEKQGQGYAMQLAQFYSLKKQKLKSRLSFKAEGSTQAVAKKEAWLDAQKLLPPDVHAAASRQRGRG